MKQRITKRLLALFLAFVMLLSVAPMTVFATGSTTSYDDFVANLKVLEGYADEYAASTYRDPGELVLNFIRTGVERYQDDNWETLAGQEIIGFTSYVEAKDEELGTNAMALRDIKAFTIPNGNEVDFGHMFGCMNISYVNKGSADLSGWAGDLCDLLNYTAFHHEVPQGTVDEMAAYILEECFGVDASEAFGWDDFWGDMDAYYLVTEYQKADGDVKISALMEEYFTEELNDIDRTVYFMNNRFGVADSKEAVRKAIYDSYSADVGVKILESKRGLSAYTTLREACCYAVADYIYSQAQGKLVAREEGDTETDNDYYTVFSTQSSVLAPGITQDIKYAQTVDGKQIVYYVATVDVTRDDVTIMVNYKDNKPPVPGENIGLQRVEDQVAALVENNKDKENFYPIVATNGAAYNITNGTPSGLVVMQGVEYYPVGAPGFFAILKDGTAMIGSEKEYNAHREQIQEGIAAFGAVLVKDGQINVTKNSNYTASRASRTAIGIKEDGSVVMMVLDGRQLPFSAGGAMEEIAQIMLDAGCVQAVNLDGGGSTTYMSKPAGSDEIEVINRPSDGYARSVATSLVAVSTAKSSNEFESAIISSDYEYITAGTSMQFTVTGVSNTGNAAVIPEGSYWRVSDGTVATINQDGLFTAIKNGTVDVEYVVNDQVVGSITVGVVVPTSLAMASSSMKAIYGKPATMPIQAYYRGEPVCVKDADFYPVLAYGSMDNMQPTGSLTFTVPEGSNYRTVMAGAMLLANQNLMAYLTVNLYHENEANFDFDNATQGNRKFAWLREVSNTHTLDDMLYRISDPEAPINIDYTFALDISSFEIPPQLEPMMGMLPSTSKDATPWTLLLSMAERVCSQTNVVITAEFSKDLIVDISELKVHNDYFVVDSVQLSPDNVLTIKCVWVNQDAPIDPLTANSLCMLTGIKATVKDTASFYNNEIIITNNGTVSYDIYLAASSLYSFVTNPANNAQALYGLYPFVHEEACRGENGVDAGAHFSSQYIDFADSYVVNTEIRQGWHEEGGSFYYYVDNVALTGTQLVADREDKTKLRFYEFDEDGKLVSEQGVTGLIEFDGNLYYPALGVVRTGWYEIEGKFYYFHPDTGRAVDGKVTIRENKNSWQTADFEYTFEDHILVKGVWMNDSQLGYSGWRYRWAGDWIVGEWFEADGKIYFSNKNEYGYVRTGYQHYIPSKEDTTKTKCYLFDERGALRTDYSGPAVADSGNVRFFKNGELFQTSSNYGLMEGSDGYYYFVQGGALVLLGANKWVGVAGDGSDWTRGLVATGTYTFDEFGRLTKQLVLTGNDAIKNNTPDNVTTTVIGSVLTVENDTSCKVVYKDETGKYVSIDSMENPYGDGYNFTIPTDAAQVEIIINGDVNGDKNVSSDDVTDLKDEVLGKNEGEVSDLGMLVGDINGDGEITALDLALLAAASGDPNFKLGW